MAAMFKCAVTSLPRCYDYFETSTFSMYFHSPFSCGLTEQQIIELQEIHNRGMEMAEATVSSTSPAMETSSSTSLATSTHDDGEDMHTKITTSTKVTQHWSHTKTGTGHHAGKNVTNSNRVAHGKNEEQKGSWSNNGSNIAGFSKFPFLLLMIWSRMLSRNLTL